MTPIADISGLVERVEAASGPDRELDCLIENALGLAKFERDPRVNFGDADYTRAPYKHYTASLDAAMTLVPEGWGFAVHTADDRARTARAVCWTEGNRAVRSPKTSDDGPIATPALALCAAALRARSTAQGPTP